MACRRGEAHVFFDLLRRAAVPMTWAMFQLNRANDNLPGSTLGAADFGVVSSARPARTLQLGARLTF